MSDQAAVAAPSNLRASPGRVAGKVALITGGGGGLGQATALRLAEEGAAVVCVDVDEPGLAETQAILDRAGHRGAIMSGDATEEACAAAAADLARSQFGPVDIVVNTVGGGLSGHIWDATVEDWDKVIRLNLRSAFLFTRAVVGEMIARKAGRIVCLSSGAREGSPWMSKHLGNTAYGTSKAGIHGFIRSLALELGEYSITANAVAPGPIPTKNTGPHLERLRGLQYDPETIIPLHRWGEPDDIANAVLFLASDEAKYITGVTLNVTGGR